MVWEPKLGIELAATALPRIVPSQQPHFAPSRAAYGPPKGQFERIHPSIYPQVQPNAQDQLMLELRYSNPTSHAGTGVRPVANPDQPIDPYAQQPGRKAVLPPTEDAEAWQRRHLPSAPLLSPELEKRRKPLVQSQSAPTGRPLDSPVDADLAALCALQTPSHKIEMNQPRAKRRVPVLGQDGGLNAVQDAGQDDGHVYPVFPVLSFHSGQD